MDRFLDVPDHMLGQERLVQLAVKGFFEALRGGWAERLHAQPSDVSEGGVYSVARTH